MNTEIRVNRRRTGTAYEQRAEEFLRQNGFEILDRNFRIRTGEIDLIAREGNVICFTEVKFRKDLRFGSPAEAVTPAKQRTIIRTSEYWLLGKRLGNALRRYDIVEILGTDISLIRNAFAGKDGII